MAITIILLGCKAHDKPNVSGMQIKMAVKVNTVTTDTTKDKQEIQKLIRNILAWAEDKKSTPVLLPYLINEKDSLVTGFDLARLKGIDDSLKITGFFSKEFIDTYNHIIQELDKKMKNKQIAPFSAGEIPPFAFDSDSDPWCDCQDVPYDSPNAYSFVDVHIIRLNNTKGKLYWTWGNLPAYVSPDWKDGKYNFNVQKEDGKWKVSYLQGFDIY